MVAEVSFETEPAAGQASGPEPEPEPELAAGPTAAASAPTRSGCRACSACNYLSIGFFCSRCPASFAWQ